MIFDKTFASRLMQWLVAPIPITKGMPDSQVIKDIVSIMRQRGIVSLAPSGNTTCSGREAHIDMASVKLAKLLKVPLLLYRFDGMFGVDPRFRRKLRKGKTYGQVQRVVSPEEIAQMSDEQLLDVIRVGLQTPKDRFVLSEYKSKIRAEYLERFLFVCPNCEAECTLSSDGHLFGCSACNSSWEYTTGLTFKAQEGTTREVKDCEEWFYFQLDFIRKKDYTVYGKDEVIYSDSLESLYKKPKRQNKILLAENVDLLLYKDRLEIGSYKFSIDGISNISIQSRTKMLLYYGNEAYVIFGAPRSNHYKYMAAITQLNKRLKEKDFEYLEL
jgi:1-acyl-sn-glycerol-3-phosphate acyltransferase